MFFSQVPTGLPLGMRDQQNIHMMQNRKLSAISSVGEVSLSLSPFLYTTRARTGSVVSSIFGGGYNEGDKDIDQRTQSSSKNRRLSSSDKNNVRKLSTSSIISTLSGIIVGGGIPAGKQNGGNNRSNSRSSRAGSSGGWGRSGGG